MPASKLILRLPATWAGIQAAGALEAKGAATQVFHVYSLVQGVAAAQAGVSVVQPNVGRTRDWFNKHPGVIRDPHVRAPLSFLDCGNAVGCCSGGGGGWRGTVRKGGAEERAVESTTDQQTPHASLS